MTVPLDPPLVVYKLGGSLLERPGLAGFLRGTIAQRPHRGALIVVGGGRTADLVRRWDRIHELGEETAHWLALDAMRLNEALVAQLLPESRAVRNGRQVAAALTERVISLLCSDCFVRWGESAGHPPVPRTWRATSDSIAAWSAGLLAAEELVLIKSVPVSMNLSLEQAAHAGLVDGEFPALARCLPRISWVDGRADPALIHRWNPPQVV